ncbi:MAG: MATE family efflux transporter [Clostridia bacterium]|nr:MATE family efflux transporter [Clostridia bacterium]
MLLTRKETDMVNGPLFRDLIIYTIPIILSGLLQLMFNAADLIVVGRYCGHTSVAAIGACSAIINLITNLAIGLSVGVSVAVAVAIGAGDSKRCSKAVHTAIPVALIGGLFMTAIGVLFAKPILAWNNTPDDVLDLSATYMRIYFAGIIATMIYNYGAAILRAAGDTQHPLYYLTAAGVLNVILNVIFITVLGRNVDGVALATTISQCLSAMLVLRFLAKSDGPIKLNFKKMTMDWICLKQIIVVGLPAGLQGCMFSISNIIIQRSINSFASVAMSGNAAAANVEGFTYQAMNSFHQTAMNFTGQNYGARRLDRLKKVYKYTIIDVTITGIITGWLTFLFARPLLGLYITDSKAAIEYGVTRMMMICIPYFLCGIMDVMSGLLRGLGNSMMPMVSTVLLVCVFRVAWVYTVWQLPEMHNLTMLYLTYPISWILNLIVLNICYFRTMRRLTSSDIII